MGRGEPDRAEEPLSAAGGEGQATAATLHAPVVGIGASAGGLEAFTRLVSNLRKETGLAYVLVQHLDPVHESQLPEILDRAAPIDVVVATDGVSIEPDHVYVIPPGTAMTVTDGHLRVVKHARALGVHTLIDTFFDSLSSAHGSDAVGVILSGAGSDGARGIEAIKESGGITIAQEPSSARFSSMPESAVATGSVDFILSPEQIAEYLVKIGRLTSQRRKGEATPESAEYDVEKILQLVRNQTGVDFRHYRAGTVQRRILRRMLAHRSEGHRDYLAHIRADPIELDVLCEDILIGVTRFFRDPDAFAELQNTGFPAILKGRPSHAPLRIWVAGCSGGEESYSVAILALEYLALHSPDTPVQLFGTDLNGAAITRARAGLYAHSIEADVSPERLQRFFVREEGGYRITRQVRDLCVFARHNLVQDPPFSQLDLITCRNVLIYFDAALQRRAMEVFHYGLNANGVLMLGGAETATAEHFAPLIKRHKLFRPKPRARAGLDMEVRAPIESFASRPTPGLRSSTDRPITQTIQQDADRAVLARVAPPGVVIDAGLEIVQFRGDTTGFLQHSPGAASLGLLKLVRPEFLPWLRSALEQASVDAKAVRGGQIVIRDGESVRRVAVDLIPFRSGPSRERYFAILFDDETEQPLQLPADSTTPRRRVQKSAIEELDSSREIARLTDELSEAKRYLQDVIEQYEATNEELHAASEEVQSSNEELRSTNEELETTKEEVQSTNEELLTINEELRHRNRELAAVSSDLANVFASTQIPIVIVDSALAIRRFTPVAERVFKLIATDVGRPLGDVRRRFDLTDLEARVEATISSLEISQADIRDEDGRWWALTVRPYLTVDRKVDGAVLVFTDIDATKKQADQTAETSESRRLLLIEAEEARAEAAAANLAKMTFLTNMSHDLRTPLNAIAGYADMLSLHVHGPLTAEQEVDLQSIKRSARHLLSLINDILNYARIETGHLNLQIVSVPVVEVMTVLRAIVHPQARAKGLTFATEACEGTILADREKLQQVLLNLVTNAIKFTESGEVSVRCRRTGSAMRIEVSDTGIGIPADQLERIFEPFIQVSRSPTSVKHEGVGLGLSISRDLARAMGGDIAVRSVPGQGSTFTVTLPRGDG